MTVTEVQVIDSLREVYDPEIPINIVELGLIYNVKIKPAMQFASELAPKPAEPLEDVELEMTLTSPGCPSHVSIEQSVKTAIEKVPGVQSAKVNWVFQPQWTPERISAEGRQKLGIEV
jgi:metal-sulfur cluster biosynthetic enzyme